MAPLREDPLKAGLNLSLAHVLQRTAQTLAAAGYTPNGAVGVVLVHAPEILV